VLPALGPTAGLAMIAVPAAVSSLPGTGLQPPGASPILVTVAENASPTVIDLSPAIATMSGIRPATGLKLSILGNTNSGLVQTNLSKAALTLTYSPGATGTATITVRATDADGVSAQQTLLVTVHPLWSLGSVGAVPLPAGMPPGPVGAAP
jgi:hypothetical protein